jgi:hypothetical protein
MSDYQLLYKKLSIKLILYTLCCEERCVFEAAVLRSEWCCPFCIHVSVA